MIGNTEPDEEQRGEQPDAGQKPQLGSRARAEAAPAEQRDREERDGGQREEHAGRRQQQLRTQEIGIRIALGATAAQVRALVLRQAALVLGTGLVVGLAGALVLGRWLSSLAFEISPWDPRILLTTALLLTITGFLAPWLPARRASQVEPTIALHQG